MTNSGNACKTTVGNVDAEVLEFTVGNDPETDLLLAVADCIGTAAHVTMLSRMPVNPPVFTKAAAKKVVAELARIMAKAGRGEFRITLRDQDVHMAIESELTRRLGELGRKVHTGRSRNDQVAVDLRLFAKEQLLCTIGEALDLAGVLLAFAQKHRLVPMVGRTHMQPAMPSSVGLWLSAYAESLLDDVVLLTAVYELNDQCPLGSAASYGVPLPIDRNLTARLLGFNRPVHNVLYANNARGKVEALVLSACGQVMLSISRLAQDLIVYTMPEFDYFSFPREFGTGSSIMPQKNNPDVLELVRAKAAVVLAQEACVAGIVRALPGGYNRDLQETKQPFVSGIAATRASLRIMKLLVSGLVVHTDNLMVGFTPGVFATDRALDLVGKGMPFRDAYRFVKENLSDLEGIDPRKAVAAKKHLGAPAGLDLRGLKSRLLASRRLATMKRKGYSEAVSRLMGVKYPLAV